MGLKTPRTYRDFIVSRSKPTLYLPMQERSGALSNGLLEAIQVKRWPTPATITVGAAAGPMQERCLSIGGATGVSNNLIALPAGLKAASAILTLECWFNTLTRNESLHGYLLKIGPVNTGAAIAIGATGDPTTNGNKLLAYYDGSAVVTGPSVTRPGWHHAAVGFMDDGYTYFSLDGVVTEVAGPAGGTVAQTSDLIEIGSRIGNQIWPHSMCHAAIYARLLEAPEMIAHATFHQ